MKKLTKFLLLALLATGLYACQEEPEIPAPEIKLGQSEVSLTSNGATVPVGYIIENSLEGEKITVTYEADWLTVGTNKVRTLEFSATENTEPEERSATVTISYKGAEDATIVVTQACYDTPLRIELLEVTAADLYFSVFTSDAELTWLPMVSSKAYFDSQRSDTALFEDNLEYFEYLAEINDLTLEEYLTEMVAVGTIENILFEGLEPSTEYVLYVYGITPQGVRTTDVVSEAFTTEAPWDGAMTFEFNVMEENHTLFFDVTPSHTGVPYYFSVFEKSDVERWMAEYNTSDICEAVQKGDIDANIQLLLDYEFISDESDYYAIFNQTGRLFDEQMACNGSTDYIFFAAKWDEKCQLQGEASTFEYTSQPVAPSDNQLTIEVTNISKSSADAVVTTTNNDPYVILPVQSKSIENLDDKALFEYLYANYSYLMSEYTFVGNKTRSFGSLEPGVQYTFVVFGYMAGTQTTDYILRKEFSTERSDDPKDCTFEFEWTVDTEEAWVQVTPSDDGHHYYWNIFDARFSAQEVKDYISDVIIGEWYEGDFAAFASWRLDQGTTSETISGLIPDTNYRVAVVIMDYESGEYLTDVIFSETFRTKAVEYANLEVSVDFEPYFDIQDLVSAGYRNYREYLQYGDALLPATINISGDYSSFFFTVYGGDLSDTELYPDSIFIEYLPQDGCYYDSALFPIYYDEEDPYGTVKMYTMCAIAYDHNGRFSHIYRRPFGCIKSNTASPDIFVDPTKAPAAKALPEWRPFEEFRVMMGDKKASYKEPSVKVNNTHQENTLENYSAEMNAAAAKREAKERVEGQRSRHIISEKSYVVPVK